MQKKKPTVPIAVKAYDFLKERIVGGSYIPGDKISEQFIADHLNVSRSPVREAIRRLADEGLVDYYPNRGAFVKKYTESDIKDNIEVRLMMEKYAISHIDQKLLKENWDKLLCLQKKLQEAERGDYADLDRELHETVIYLCGNKALMELYRMQYSRNMAFREVSLVDKAMFALATRSHTALLDSIMSGNTERALRIITKHLTESEEQIQRFYLDNEKL